MTVSGFLQTKVTVIQVRKVHVRRNTSLVLFGILHFRVGKSVDTPAIHLTSHGLQELRNPRVFSRRQLFHQTLWLFWTIKIWNKGVETDRLRKLHGNNYYGTLPSLPLTCLTITNGPALSRVLPFARHSVSILKLLLSWKFPKLLSYCGRLFFSYHHFLPWRMSNCSISMRDLAAGKSLKTVFFLQLLVHREKQRAASYFLVRG